VTSIRDDDFISFILRQKKKRDFFLLRFASTKSLQWAGMTRPQEVRMREKVKGLEMQIWSRHLLQ
jgi:hypothetical protein